MRARIVPGQPIVLRARLSGPVSEVQVRLLLDTGASRTLIRPSALASCGIDLRTGDAGHTMTTVSGLAHAPLIAVDALAALGVVRTTFRVAVFDLPPSAPVDGLLGLDFLVGLRLTLDMRAGELTIGA